MSLRTTCEAGGVQTRYSIYGYASDARLVVFPSRSQDRPLLRSAASSKVSKLCLFVALAAVWLSTVRHCPMVACSRQVAHQSRGSDPTALSVLRRAPIGSVTIGLSRAKMASLLPLHVPCVSVGQTAVTTTALCQLWENCKSATLWCRHALPSMEHWRPTSGVWSLVLLWCVGRDLGFRL